MSTINPSTLDRNTIPPMENQEPSKVVAVITKISKFKEEFRLNVAIPDNGKPLVQVTPQQQTILPSPTPKNMLERLIADQAPQEAMPSTPSLYSVDLNGEDEGDEADFSGEGYSQRPFVYLKAEESPVNNSPKNVPYGQYIGDESSDESEIGAPSPVNNSGYKEIPYFTWMDKDSELFEAIVNGEFGTVPAHYIEYKGNPGCVYFVPDDSDDENEEDVSEPYKA